MNIDKFVLKLDDLIEATSGNASYLELIGALAVAQQRLVEEYEDELDDDDDDDDDKDPPPFQS